MQSYIRPVHAGSRCHYVKAKVAVLRRRTDGTLAILHRPRMLAEYTAEGQPKALDHQAAA